MGRRNHEAKACHDSSVGSRKSLVEEIIEKTKRSHKLVNLKEVRNLYKELSPAK